MKFHDKRKAKRTIRKTAQQFDVSPAQCRKDMAEAIDEAWENSRGDPAALAVWNEYFPSGQKPSVEEFIAVLGNRIKTEQNR